MSKSALALAMTAILSSTAALANLDVEELRLPTATQAIPDVVGRYQAMVEDLDSKYRQQTDELIMTQMVARQGQRLWQQAVRDVQSGGQDDRPLYWSRLSMKQQLKQHNPAFNIASWQRKILLNAVEKSSRGFSDIQFDDSTQIRILLTGFDPFFLDRHIDQSNPSGLAALALDGYKFSVNGKKAQVETVMIPVRFADFDQGIIESLLTPIYRDNSVNAIFTISMGRDNFDLERFPGRNRSATAPDNLNVLTGASPSAPKAPMFDGKTLNGPEFVEFSLPVAAMQGVEGPWKVNDNHTVTTLAKGEFEAKSLLELQSATSVEGSGGGYLSNEISYRAVLLGAQFNSAIPVGHIHTPRVAAYEAETEMKIVAQIKAMVEAAATQL
ncbi:hypothetical protein [Shewanella psychrotolerans]|uniref:hypothetical protein n=1 Tax=Shewanella psychrotolerans TaxID=2864206 RepID=UPI001C661F81|nr:hypothetical protein [Shewanella psychrotolerans]QYK00936.1 hypothetical protein K0I62_16330 [Shewanella psychrotolerans]